MRPLKNLDIHEEQIGYLPYVFTLERNVVDRYYETYYNPIYASTVMPLLVQVMFTPFSMEKSTNRKKEIKKEWTNVMIIIIRSTVKMDLC